jgi:Protein of unknown function (DUF1579)
MSDNQQLPQPDPALWRLDRLVGTWTIEGNLVGSDVQNIRGQMTFRWLPGGFFLEQRARIDFAGQQVDALELIGHDHRPTPSPPRCSPASRRRHCPTAGTSATTG